jgi:glycosyltransferase involved in cell wall biosynthesis
VRVLLFGDLAGTFGTVTMDLGRELLAVGHDVRFLSQNELGDLPEPFDSRTYKVNDRDGWRAQDGDLRDLVSFYGPLQGRMGSTGYHDRNLGMPREILNVLYNAADVYVSPGSEGFGLTIAEALACGVPAVGMDFSAVPEVIGPAGLLAPVASYTDAYAHLWGNVDEEAFGRQVAHLLDTPNERGYLGALGPSHIARSFTWAKAAEVFDGVFQAALNEEVAA